MFVKKRLDFLQPVYIWLNTKHVLCLWFFDNMLSYQKIISIEHYISFLNFLTATEASSYNRNTNPSNTNHTNKIFVIRCRKIGKFLWNDKIWFICQRIGCQQNWKYVSFISNELAQLVYVSALITIIVIGNLTFVIWLLYWNNEINKYISWKR